MLRLICLLLLCPLLYGGCLVPCVDGTLCDGISCKEKNDNIQVCTLASDCADPIRGGCYDSKCRCNETYIWSTVAGRCLIRSDGSGSCRIDADCRESGGYCAAGKCKCLFTAYWKESESKCEGRLGTSNSNSSSTYCDSTLKCLDKVRGHCQDQRCVCNETYEWSSWTSNCSRNNTGLTDCTSTEDCVDTIYGECRAGHCECLSTFEWVDKLGRCARPVNLVNTCTRSTDCDTTVGDCFEGKCVCKANYRWYDSAQACVLVNIANDNKVACMDLSQCADTVNGVCRENCTCNTGFAWGPASRKCIKPNTGYSCVDVLQCADSTIGICSGGQCKCPSGSSYHVDNDHPLFFSRLSCYTAFSDIGSCTMACILYYDTIV